MLAWILSQLNSIEIKVELGVWRHEIIKIISKHLFSNYKQIITSTLAYTLLVNCNLTRTGKNGIDKEINGSIDTC